MTIIILFIISLLTLGSLQATLQTDTYHQVSRVGKDLFVAVGEQHAHLYDSSLMLLNHAPKKLNTQALKVVTIYPLNYTLILESDKSLTSIKWDGANAPDKKTDVEIGNGYINFQTLACLDDSTLCFINTLNPIRIIRFDVRTIHDTGLSDPFYLEGSVLTSVFEKFKITDTNLKYFSEIYNSTTAGMMNPITLNLIDFHVSNESGANFKSIHSFLSTFRVFVKNKDNSGFSFRTLVNTNQFTFAARYSIIDSTADDEMRAIRGTRYLGFVGKDTKIRFLWYFYSGVANQNQIDVIDFVPASKPLVTKVSSFDYYRVDDDTFRFVGISSEANNEIWTKDILVSELGFLDDNAVIDQGVGLCYINFEYMDNRCYGCQPGKVLVYSNPQNGGDFDVECLEVDSSINKNYFDEYEFKSVRDCFDDPNRCGKCTVGRDCLSCGGEVSLFDGKCLEKCPPSYRGINNVCQLCTASNCYNCDNDLQTCSSCPTNLPYLKNGDCVASCGTGFKYIISNGQNICQADSSTPKEDCLSDQIRSIKDNTCIYCPQTTVRREGVCIPLCPYGEIEKYRSCVACPSGLWATKDNTCVGQCNSTEPFIFEGSCILECTPPQVSSGYGCVSLPCQPFYELIDGYCKPLFCNKITEVFLETGCSPVCPLGKVTEHFNACSFCPNSGKVKNGVCVDSCGDGYYVDGLVCSQCDSSCSTCSASGPSGCLTCDQSALSTTKFLKASSCLVSCGNNFYADTSNNCQSCDPTCLTCSGGSSTQCLSCDSSSINKLKKGTTCVTACGDNFYEDTPNLQCLACDSTCLTCATNNPTQCLSCDSSSANKLKKGTTCVNTCGNNFYEDTPNLQCVACDPTCLTCATNNPTQCLSCNPVGSFKLKKGTTCVSACGNNFYKDALDICQPCDSTCLTCATNNPTQCLSCDPSSANKLKKGTICVNTCGNNFYKDSSNICQPCNSNCLTCVVDNPTKCLSCDSSSINKLLKQETCVDQCGERYYKNGSDTECLDCSTDCLTCDGPNNDNCLTCDTNQPSTLPHFDLGRCKSSCGIGKYSNSGICEDCHDNCSTCSASGTSSCLTCPPDRFQSSNSCPLKCGFPFLIAGSNCQDCLAPNWIFEGKCFSSCPKGTVEGQSSNECQSCAEDEVWFDGKCSNTCPTKEELESKNGEIYPENNFCTKVCPISTYKNKDYECIDCPKGCTICSIDENNIDEEVTCNIKAMSIIFKNFDEKSKKMSLKFDSKISNKNIENLSFFLDKEEIEVKSIKLTNNNNNIEAVLNITKNEVNRETLEIRLPSDKALHSKDDKLAYSNFPIKYGMNYYLPSLAQYIKYTGITAQAMTTAVGSLTMASEPSSSMRLQKLMQSLKFLSLINIQIPNIVTSFTKNLDVASRNIFSLIMDTNEDQYYCNLPLKVQLINLSCVGLNNTSIEVTIILILIIFKIIISIPAFLLRKRNQKLNKVEVEPKQGKKKDLDTKDDKNTNKKGWLFYLVDKLDHLLTLALIIPLANAFSLKLLIGNWATFYSLHKLSIYSMASLFVLTIILVYNLGFLLLALYFIYTHKHETGKNKQKEKEKKQSPKSNIFISIFDAICNLSRTRNVFYSIFVTIQDLSLGFILVMGQKTPLLQLFISSVLFFVESIMIIALRPLKSLKANIIQFFNTVTKFFIVMFFTLIYLFEEKMTSKQVSHYFGLPIIILLVLVVLANILVEFIFTLKFLSLKLYSLITKYCSKSSKENTKNTENEEEKNNIDDKGELNESLEGLNNEDLEDKNKSKKKSKKKKKQKELEKKKKELEKKKKKLKNKGEKNLNRRKKKKIKIKGFNFEKSPNEDEEEEEEEQNLDSNILRMNRGKRFKIKIEKEKKNKSKKKSLDKFD